MKIIFRTDGTEKASRFFKEMNDRYMNHQARVMMYLQARRVNKYDFEIDYIPPLMFNLFYMGIIGVITVFIFFGWHWLLVIPALMITGFFFKTEIVNYWLIKGALRKSGYSGKIERVR